jgi:multiple sugar transport system permease protein
MATADTTAPRKGAEDRFGKAERALAYRMVAPSLIVIGLVAFYPIGYAVYLSLNEYSVRVADLSRFAGLRNYYTAFSDPLFWEAFRTTFVFTGLSVALEFAIGLGMALAMHEAFKGRALLRTTVLVPWAVLTVVTAMLWRGIFEPELGFMNTMLGALGLPGADVVWLGQEPYALGVMVFADVWKTAPFMGLLLLAGLQVIPGDVYEAARVDGANRWQRFVRITLPLLRPAILVALLFRTLDALRIFDLPFVLTQGANGTSTLSLIAYEELTQNRLLGLGSALSVITFVIVMTVSFLYIRFVGGNIRNLADT